MHRCRGGVCDWEQLVRHLIVERVAPRAEQNSGVAVAVASASREVAFAAESREE